MPSIIKNLISPSFDFGHRSHSDAIILLNTFYYNVKLIIPDKKTNKI